MIQKKVLNAIKNTKLKHFAIKFETCTLCSWRIQIKTNNDEMAVRCTRCFASPVAQSLGAVVKSKLKSTRKSLYELSSRGAFVRFLFKQNLQLTLSEYFDNCQTGTVNDGVLCQDVEKLTFADESFDMCTSLEVFEHVENDIQGFKEIHRVLKKNGCFIFTVPINLNTKTQERTRLIDGKRVNTMPAEYHSDNIRGTSQVFCYRNYGIDIIDRLKAAGFYNAEIIRPQKEKLFGFGRPVIIAFKTKE